MDQFLQYTLIGLVTGALYAIAASGLVVTYTTSGIFNFAHGAFGMIAAFTYWQLRVEWNWPAPIALVAVLLVLAPAFGAGIERTIMRGLKNVTEVTKLVVSVSLLFGVTQVAAIVWPNDVGRRLPGFFEGNSIDFGVYDMPWHEAITIVGAIATAVALRFLLFGTRNGVAMRAVVDDRELTQLNGARPDRSSMAAWAIGTMLAGLAGILLAGTQGGLSQLPLTLLVVNAYGAALFGRLRSLPLTFVGAVVLGLGEAYLVGYVDINVPVASIARFTLPEALSLSSLRSAVPIIVLFLVLLFLPALKVRAGGQLRSREVIPAPPVLRWLIGTVVLGLLAFGFATAFPGIRTFEVGQGMALAIIMLSLVPLIGYAGQISLAPMAFAGVGAIVMGAWGGTGDPLVLLAAVAISAVVGALVALPAIRLQGLYLALATAAFAVLMDYLVFTQNAFLPNGNLNVSRLDLFGLSALSFDDDRAHLVLLGVTFGLVATLVVWIRSNRFGRRLLAMKSSEAACVTLGVDLATTKLAVFTLSAAIAGLGGALYGAQLNSVSPPTFQFLQGLPVVFLAVIGGIAAAGGALFGGLIYAVAFFIVPDVFPSLRNLAAVAPALAGISLGRNPNGAVNETVLKLRERFGTRDQHRAGAGAGNEDADRASAISAMDGVDLDRLGLDGFTEADLEALDAAVGLADEPLYGPARRARRPVGSSHG